MNTRIIKEVGIRGIKCELNINDLHTLLNAMNAVEAAECAFKALQEAKYNLDNFYYDDAPSEAKAATMQKKVEDAQTNFDNMRESAATAITDYHGFIKELLKDYSPAEEPTFAPAELTFIF